jgi:FkbM family methyltransferase
MKQVYLPNGLVVNALNGTEADVLYHEIFTMQSYQQHGVEIADGNCVFDIGANIGLYSLFLARSYQNLRLFAFEPIPSLFAVLQQNAKTLFPEKNAQLLNIGLSNRSGTAEFTFNPSLSMTASMYPDVIAQSSQKQLSIFVWLQALINDMALVSRLPSGLARSLNRLLSNRYLRIPTLGLVGLPLVVMSAAQRLKTKRIRCSLKTISQVIQENNLKQIDLIKVDVEGSELDVIQGIDENDWPKIRQFIIEVHDLENRLSTLVSLFHHHGFRTVVDQEDWALHKLMNIYTLYAFAGSST